MATGNKRPPGFSTLTHARLRAEQGDRSGARKVLRAILEREPWNREARDYFEQLAGQDRPRPDLPQEKVPRPPVEARAEDLGERFRQVLDGGADPRIHRLSAWLDRISDHQGESDDQ